MKYLLSLVAFFAIMSCAVKSDSTYSQIKYKAGPCFGTCPMFEMTINPDRSAVIDAEHFTFEKGGLKDVQSREKEGVFRATISETKYAQLISMMNDLNVKSLQSKYGDRSVTDMATSYLTVTYKDGTQKTIEDYGKNGTVKLKNLYQFIEDLRFSQNWRKVD